METIKFCLYARKSSERDELQALSIDSQIKEMLDLAARDGIDVVDIYKESYSAKDSGQRPVFMQLITDIRSQKFGGILTWAPDRLSRNAGDLGSLVDLMDQKKLEEIRTHGQVFHNSPNEKFLLMILCSQAKLENDNRGLNVKRGLRAKCEMGYRPGVTPLGYLNDKYAKKGQKAVTMDPERAPLIQQIFEKVAYEEYSGHKVLYWLNNTTDFTTRSGKKLVLSTLYLMLRDSYYYGRFEYPKGSGMWYDVNHESIITKELFDIVQERLTVVSTRRPGTKEFDFTRLIQCGGCGSGVCAEEKFKKVKNGIINRYVYYHCTKGKRVPCEEPYIREEDLLNQLLKLIDTIDIYEIVVHEKLEKELLRYQKFTQGVLNMGTTPMNAPMVDIRSYAKYVLKEGTREEKRDVLSCLKNNLILKNQIIYISSNGLTDEARDC
ncbi:MAG TPA: recombinase family protein [Candidatus Andersenbacteria bacterium]|nr:recombinase family protein [Candidatus Andersenbacteria bacterium]